MLSSSDLNSGSCADQVLQHFYHLDQHTQYTQLLFLINTPHTYIIPFVSTSSIITTLIFINSYIHTQPSIHIGYQVSVVPCFAISLYRHFLFFYFPFFPIIAIFSPRHSYSSTIVTANINYLRTYSSRIFAHQRSLHIHSCEYQFLFISP